MSAITDVWRYIDMGLGGSSCGHAELMRRRGWAVGEPVHFPHDPSGRSWYLPCSREAST